ncbi:hypothetical protein G9C85_16700 [Halorubellus sp. JP-L1]|uniref:hypothetical protein n=1 Tax=Halorubellus sp. JP-L1 TaxID=2715753 RepID=UPI00140C411A|nr:hypothetical protein [Halorubellus sp. JP-L1]NHN43258.1 hypothetical protein [Halorubellus sp. JP-L1]
MDPIVGVVIGLAMVVGGGLVFRHAEELSGLHAGVVPAGGTGRRGDALALKVALTRSFALGAAVLGVATALSVLL